MFRMLQIMISSCTLHSVKLCGYTFIAKQKMYRLWHSTWYIPPGHCLYYHRHYHLHQFTSVEDLLATTIANDQLYWVTTAFSNFLKRASTVLLLQSTFYQIRKAVISSRHNQLFCRCFCPFFHWHPLSLPLNSVIDMLFLLPHFLPKEESNWPM